MDETSERDRAILRYERKKRRKDKDKQERLRPLLSGKRDRKTERLSFQIRRGIVYWQEDDEYSM